MCPNSRYRCLTPVGLLTILVGALLMTACSGGAPDDGNRAVSSGPEQPAEQAAEEATEQAAEEATEVPDEALGPLGSVVPDSILDLRVWPHLQAGEEIKTDVIVGPPWVDGTATIVGVLHALDSGGNPRGFELLVVTASGTTRIPLADAWWEGEQVEPSWMGDRVEAVFFADVDGDATLEVIVLATYMTGIGPTGAQPFFSNDVLDWVDGALGPLEPWAARLAGVETEQSARALLRDFTATPPSGDRIAFISDRDGVETWYSVALDGTALQQIVEITWHEGGNEWFAQQLPSLRRSLFGDNWWAPDGEWLAFSANAGEEMALFVAAADGNDEWFAAYPVHQAAMAGGEPLRLVWSPDSTQILLTITRGRMPYTGDHSAAESDQSPNEYFYYDAAIYVAQIDGKALDAVTPHIDWTFWDAPGCHCMSTHGSWGPQWLSDGTEFLFIADWDGYPMLYRIASENIAGHSPEGSTDLSQPVPGTEQTDDFAVSPNANQIAFRVNAADDWESGGCRAQNLFISNSDGSNRILLTPGAPLYCVSDLRWSRDGSWVWFRASDDPDSDREEDLYGVPRSGAGLAVLVGPGGEVLSEPVELAATPNGPRLLFVADVSGDADVYTMAPDGSGIRNLTDNEAEDWNPSWSPDGTHIAFSSDRDGNAEIYLMTAMGTDVRRLTAHHAMDRTATWLSPP